MTSQHKRRGEPCGTCRKLHIKCDKVRPRRGGCTKKSLECKFAEDATLFKVKSINRAPHNSPSHTQVLSARKIPLQTDKTRDDQQCLPRLRNCNEERERKHSEHKTCLQSSNFDCSQHIGEGCDLPHSKYKFAPFGLEPLGLGATEKPLNQDEPPAFPYRLPDAPNRSNLYQEFYGLFKMPHHLDTSLATIRLLFTSYLCYVHRWYPIFYVPQLDELIEDFVARHNQTSRYTSTPSCGQERQFTLLLKPSSTDFIVFLVLALGEVCLRTRSLLPIDTNHSQDASQAHSACSLQNKVPSLTSSAQRGFRLPGAPSHPATDYEAYSTMNFDDAVVPGSFYFEGAEQLPNHDNDLLFAQSHLLLGLCKAHRAGVEAGSAAFRSAGDRLHHLLDQHNLFTNIAEDQCSRQNQLLPTGQPVGIIAMAATSCLELENVNSININRYRSRLYDADTLPLPFSSPEGTTKLSLAGNTGEYPTKILFQDHVALVILQRQLHQFSQELQSHHYPPLNSCSAFDSINKHHEALQDWKTLLPQHLQWDDKESVPPNLFQARFRAKYNYTLFKIWTPFLDYALNILPHLLDGSSVRQIAVYKKKNPYSEGDICRFESFVAMEISDIYKACNLCIGAATLSAYAYCGASSYLNPINSQDIAYPIYEIVMTLSMTSKSSRLKQYVEAESLRFLIENTAVFFKELAEDYPFFKQACPILEETRDMIAKLFGP